MPRKKKLPPYVTLKFDPPQWHVRISFPTNERDSKGRVVYEQLTRRCIPETAEQAELIVEHLRAEHRRAMQHTRVETSTVQAFLEYFLTQKKRAVGVRTADDYQKIYEHHIRGSRLAGVELSALSPLHIQSFYSGLGDRGVSGARIEKVHRFLSMAFAQAVAWKRVESNPTYKAVLPAFDRQETAAMSDVEIQAILDASRARDDFFVFELALETGLRPQELLAVRWQDVDARQGKLHVRQAIAFGIRGQGNVIKLPKTSASRRTVELSEAVIVRLAEHRAHYQKRLDELRAVIEKPVLVRSRGVLYRRRRSIQMHARAALAAYLEYDLVFPNADGGILSLNNVNRRSFKELLGLAGIDKSKYSIKNLRHTNATILAERVKPNQLQKHLGHEKIETTLTYYVHVDEDRKVNMGEVFSRAMAR
jgi:integrase